MAAGNKRKPKRKPSKVRKQPVKRKTAAKRKPAGKRKPAPARKPAAKRKPVKARGSKPKSKRSGNPRKTAKTKSPSRRRTAPRTAPVVNRATTPVTAVQARFTEPLRRASRYDNIRSLIEGQAAEHGARTYMISESDGVETTYAKLDEHTTRFANLLGELGVKPGARIAFQMASGSELAFGILGTIKSGRVAVPLSPDMGVDELAGILKDCGATVLVTDASRLPAATGAATSSGAITAILVGGGATGVEKHHKCEPSTFPRSVDLHGALQRASDSPLKDDPPSGWDEAQIIYTQDSTERWNGAVLQHRQFITAARWLSVWLKLGAEQRYLGVLPLFHVKSQVATLFTPLFTGGSVVLSRDFSVSRVWKSVERYRVTTLSAVPSILGMLLEREMSDLRGAQAALKHPQAHVSESPGAMRRREDAQAREAGLARAHDISSLERVICGAAPLPAAVHMAFEKCFVVPVIEGLSIPEATGYVAMNPGNGTRKIGSVGLPVGSKIAIQDDLNPPGPLKEWAPTSLLRMSPAVFPTAGIGEPGEICVWGETLLREFLNRPEHNPEAFAGGWFHTGLTGTLDPDGYLRVLGDRDAEVDVNADRFLPREVDDALYDNEKVETAVTIGVKGRSKGSMVTTWVVMREGTFPGGEENGRVPTPEQKKEAETELEEYLETRLPRRKRPDYIIFATRLPQDAAGKTRVMRLKQMLDTEIERGAK